MTKALSRAYGTDFAKIAGTVNGAITVEGAISAGEPDLVDLARRLGIFGFPAELGGGAAVDNAGEKLHLSVTSGIAGSFVGKAVACACADEPKPFLAAQYARGAWKNKQTAEALPGASPVADLSAAGTMWSVRSGRSTIAGARSGAELIDSQIELAGHYAYSGPAAIASLTRANGQFGQAEQSQSGRPSRASSGRPSRASSGARASPGGSTRPRL